MTHTSQSSALELATKHNLSDIALPKLEEINILAVSDFAGPASSEAELPDLPGLLSLDEITPDEALSAKVILRRIWQLRKQSFAIKGAPSKERKIDEVASSDSETFPRPGTHNQPYRGKTKWVLISAALRSAKFGVAAVCLDRCSNIRTRKETTFPCLSRSLISHAMKCGKCAKREPLTSRTWRM